MNLQKEKIVMMIIKKIKKRVVMANLPSYPIENLELRKKSKEILNLRRETLEMINQREKELQKLKKKI